MDKHPEMRAGQLWESPMFHTRLVVLGVDCDFILMDASMICTEKDGKWQYSRDDLAEKFKGWKLVAANMHAYQDAFPFALRSARTAMLDVSGWDDHQRIDDSISEIDKLLGKEPEHEAD